MLIQLSDLRKVSFKELFDIWSTDNYQYRYSGIKQNIVSFQTHLEANNFNPSLSLGIFYCEELIACSLTGQENINGQKYAFNIFTGSIDKYKGQGLEAALYETVILNLEKHDLLFYRNEIFVHEKPAVMACKAVGYKIKRELDNVRLSRSQFFRKKPSLDIVIQPDELDTIEKMSEFYESSRLGKNSLESLRKNLKNISILVARYENQPIGWIIGNIKTHRVLSLFVLPEFRLNNIATTLVENLFNLIPANNEFLNFLKVDISNEITKKFMESSGGESLSLQYEMEYSFG